MDSSGKYAYALGLHLQLGGVGPPHPFSSSPAPAPPPRVVHRAPSRARSRSTKEGPLSGGLPPTVGPTPPSSLEFRQQLREGLENDSLDPIKVYELALRNGWRELCEFSLRRLSQEMEWMRTRAEFIRDYDHSLVSQGIDPPSPSNTCSSIDDSSAHDSPVEAPISPSRSSSSLCPSQGRMTPEGKSRRRLKVMDGKLLAPRQTEHEQEGNASDSASSSAASSTEERGRRAKSDSGSSRGVSRATSRLSGIVEEHHFPPSLASSVPSTVNSSTTDLRLLDSFQHAMTRPLQRPALLSVPSTPPRRATQPALQSPPSTPPSRKPRLSTSRPRSSSLKGSDYGAASLPTPPASPTASPATSQQSPARSFTDLFSLKSRKSFGNLKLRRSVSTSSAESSNKGAPVWLYGSHYGGALMGP